MKPSRVIRLFLAFLGLTMIGCAPSMNVSILDDNTAKNYLHFKTRILPRQAVILRDTMREDNRYPTDMAVANYIPTLEEVLGAEELTKHVPVPEPPVNKFNKGTFYKAFRNYNRQYSGFIHSSGDTIIVVNFLEYKGKKKTREYHPFWKYRNEYLGGVIVKNSRGPKTFSYWFVNGKTSMIPFPTFLCPWVNPRSASK